MVVILNFIEHVQCVYNGIMFTETFSIYVMKLVTSQKSISSVFITTWQLKIGWYRSWWTNVAWWYNPSSSQFIDIAIIYT